VLPCCCVAALREGWRKPLAPALTRSKTLAARAPAVAGAAHRLAGDTAAPVRLLRQRHLADAVRRGAARAAAATRGHPVCVCFPKL
jgi:hypothetical protein